MKFKTLILTMKKKNAEGKTIEVEKSYNMNFANGRRKAANASASNEIVSSRYVYK